ncbi:hypothetical protein K1719_039437 [Acacia pycnantha]|nr:hypothetical protein K1719_039437 [Acacia pycnantha]
MSHVDVVVFVKSVGALEEFRRDNETKNKMRMLLTDAENNDLESVLFDEFSTNDYMSQLEMTMKTLVVVVLNLVRIAFSDEGRPQVCSSISATRVFFNPAIKEVKELIDRIKAHYTIADNSGVASVIFWDKLGVELLGKTAAELKAILKEA